MQDAQRDERFVSLLEATLSQPEGTRDAYLQHACEGDQGLYKEITECMDWRLRMGGFLLEPMLAIAESDAPFEPGEWIADRFQIVREIGEGGMGVVYQAFDAKRNQTIAIKAAKIGFRTLLTPELAGALKVRHANVCLVNEIHTADTTRGQIDFLTMEFLEGETLQARLKRDGAIAPEEALDIVRQLCAGLTEAHRSGVIHRDLKTSNVFLGQTAEGALRTVITDFGLASEKPEETADLAGTPQYMAPELWQGQSASKASDIYALGVMMYQMVTGQAPYEQSSYGLPATLQTLPSAVSKGLNGRWDKVILQCLSTDPEKRPASAAKVVGRLEKRKLSKIPFVFAAILSLALLIPGVRRPIVQSIWPPPNIRLAVLPFSGPAELQVTLNGALENVADRLRRARNAGSSIAVITPHELRANLIQNPAQSGRVLHATHALEGTVSREAADFAIDAYLTDVQTKTRVRHLSARYPLANAQSISDALVGTVSLALQLQGTSARERLARNAGESYLRALYFLRRDRRSFEEAIPLLQQARNADRHSPLPPAAMTEALLMKFQATKERKWLDEARRWLETSEALNPDSIHVLLAAGQLNQTLGWYETALQNYRRIQEIEPRNADALQGVANVYDAMDLPSKAIEAHLASIRSDPEYYAPYQYFGIYYYFHGKYNEAAEQFRKAIARAPGLAQAYINLGAALSDLGRDQEAEEALTASLKLKVTGGALNSLGAVKSYQKRHVEATQFYERAVELDRENYVFLFNLADSYRRTARHEDSLRIYRRAMDVASSALRENPRRGYTRAFVGYFAARLGDRRRAEEEIGQALRLSPTDQQVIRQSVLAYEAMGDRDHALETLKDASDEMLEELARQPDLGSLRDDARFLRLQKH